MRTPTAPAAPSLRLTFLLALGTILMGCGDNVVVPVTPADMTRNAPGEYAAAPMLSAPAGFSADRQEMKTQPSGGDALPDATPTMLIRTGSASIEVDSLEPAIAAVHEMAARLGGIVGNTVIESGHYRVRRASIELRIPASRFDEAIAGVRPLGRVESVTSNAQDVTEEFVDVSARVANAKRLEDRLVTLLANRTGKLEEVLAVERELARVREEIERYEGRVRFLRTRVVTSTVMISVHEREPIVRGTPGQNVIVEAFKDAWRNFVGFVAAFISSLGVLIPLAVLAAPLVIGLRRMRARRRSSGNPDAQVP